MRYTLALMCFLHRDSGYDDWIIGQFAKSKYQTVLRWQSLIVTLEKPWGMFKPDAAAGYLTACARKVRQQLHC
ncbi:MAG: hypothetical protein HYZ35_03445 [Chloroflexi bacterium]|nr:hypothetical protein [Chloroflexota bacterium]